MTRTDILDIAKKRDLDPQVISDALTPTVLLVPGEGGHSQLGGSPLLPAGMSWPRWDPSRFCEAEIADAKRRIAEYPSTSPHWTKQIQRHEGLMARGPIPLSFVAQVDLGALRRVHRVEHLPDHGLLSFFMELAEGAGCMCRAEPNPPWQVFWFPDLTALHEVSSPNEGETVIQPVAMRAEAAWTVPDQIAVDGEVVLAEFDDPDFEDFLEELASGGVLGGNQIGGHIFREQDSDARMSAALQDAGFDIWNPVREELSPPAEVRVRRWQHLLQIATDYGSGDWVGVSTFWRHEGAWEPGLLRRVQQYFEQT